MDLLNLFDLSVLDSTVRFTTPLLLACLARAAALATGVRGGASPPPTAMIAGGGIGGLVTALTLRNEGYDVRQC